MAAPSLVRLSLRANVSWTFAGNVVYAACQWAMLVALAKLGSPQMVGQFALGLAVSTPIFMLANLQLRALQATDARHTYTFGDYLALRLAMTALALLLIGAVVMLSGYALPTALAVLAVAFAKAIEALCDVFYGLFQQHERMDGMSRSLMLRGALGLLALVAAIALTGSVLWGALALALAWAGVLLAYDMRNGRAMAGGRLAARWHGPTLLRLARLAAPLGFVMMLIALNASVPRYIVQQVLGAEALGIFAAIAYIERAGTTLVGALGQAASPRLAQHHAAGNTRAFRALLGKLLGIGGAIGAGGVLVALLAGRPLLALLYEEAYARADVFAWVMVAAGLWYMASFLGYAATARRIIGWQPVVLCAAVGVALLASVLLIPAHGLSGAALAMVAAAAVALVGYAALLGLPDSNRRGER
jgi:O-antigen/teichoic acid export membrane protein